MEINYNKILEIHGKEYIELIKEYQTDLILNLKYLDKLGFDYEDIIDIFERYTSVFIENNKVFINKFNKLISNLGVDYLEIITNDLSILESLQ